MKTNNLGTIVELDKTKQYIMLVDATAMSREQASEIRIENGLIIFPPEIQGKITFVENSDRIIDVKVKEYE